MHLGLLENGKPFRHFPASKVQCHERDGLCAVAFGLGAFDFGRSWLANGLPAVGCLADIVLILALCAVASAWRGIGRLSIPAENRRSLRRRVVLAAFLAGAPLTVANLIWVVAVLRDLL